MKSFSKSMAAVLVTGITLISFSVASADLVIRNASDQIVSGGGSLDLGETVAVDPRSIQIQISNTGSEALGNVSCGFQGVAAADYSLVSLPPTTIPAMSSVNVTIRFAPQALGQRSASLVISSALPAPLQASVSLTGVGGTVFAPIVPAPSSSPIITQAWSGDYTFGVINLGYRPTPSPILISQLSGSSGSFIVPPESIVYGSYNGRLYMFKYGVVLGPPPARIATRTLTLFSGKADPTFDLGLSVNGGYGTVAIQPDGKILLTGFFNSVKGQPKAGIVRLNPDGSIDPSFIAKVDNLVTSISIDDQGMIFLGGFFSEVNGVERSGLAKLHPDGTLDESFVPMLAEKPERFVTLPEGKVMLCGTFGTSGPVYRQNLVRLLSDGSVDPAFDVGNAVEAGAAGPLYSLLAQPEGKIISGPVIVDGETIYLARFNADGSVDTTFECDIDATVSAMVLQNDGRILVGGHFKNVNGVPRRCIARLNPDGTLDTGFSPSAPYGNPPAVSGIALQADGGIIISGVFEGVGSQDQGVPIARLFPDGTFDKSFQPGGNGERLTGLAIDRTGSIFVTGLFSSIGGLSRRDFAKLTTDPGTSVLDFVDADSLRWTLEGSAPMFSSVQFEVSTDSGATWSSLGQGTPVPEGWQIDGVTLPSNGFLRARGRQLVSNRGFGMIGEIKLFGRGLSPLEAWRQEKFSTPLNHADAANTFDADSDGVPNLLEYGFALDPKNPASNQIPAWNPSGDGYVVSFQKRVGMETLIHGGEWSETMLPNDWHPAEDLSNGNEKSFRVPFDSRSKLFFRLKVTAP